MMKQLFFIALVFLVRYGYGQSGGQPIKVDISGLKNDTVYVWYSPLTNWEKLERDTLTASKGSFEYKVPIHEPALLAILPKDSFHTRKSGSLYMPQTKFIEMVVTPNEKIRVEAMLSQYEITYYVQGSKFNQELMEFMESYRKTGIEAVKIELQIDSLSASKDNKEEVNNLFSKRGELFSEIAKARIQYIRQYPGRDLSAYLLTKLSLNAFAQYYLTLDAKVREGIFSHALQEKYLTYTKYTAANKAEKELVEGKIAPGFTLKDINGKPVSLDNSKGKLIVLDFWGSW